MPKWTPVKLNRPSVDENFLKIAHNVAERSEDAETHVGAVITVNNRIVATGFNGLPANFPNGVFPNTRPDKYPWMVHAEANAIINAAREGNSVYGGTLYCTHMPCFEKCCWFLVHNAGIKRVVVPKGAQTLMTRTKEYEQQLFIFLSYSNIILEEI